MRPEDRRLASRGSRDGVFYVTLTRIHVMDSFSCSPPFILKLAFRSP